MRFFAHDGKSTHGPAGVEELLKLPGFDGDTLVCPVGSDDSADWKPALAYPPFKKALLGAPVAVPAQAPTPAPPPPLPPPPTPAPPAPAAKTSPCPRCAHANLEEARFCNSCGARMDGRLENISPAPSESVPPEPAPTPLPESPRPPLQPGRMGQLGAYEEVAPAATDSSPSPAPAPEPAPTVAAVPVWKRPAVLAAFALAAVVAAGLGYTMLGKNSPEVPGEAVAEPAPLPEATPQPAPVIYTAPPQTSSPAMPPPSAAAPPKRARKPRPVRAAKPEPEPRAVENTAGKDPLLEALLGGEAQSAAEPGRFSLPGLERPVSAGPGKSPPPAGIEDAPVKSAEGDQLALVQVHEQFDFCAQLLAQGAYGDHYDTCLCKDAREAAPYRGSRGFYVTAKKKEAGGGHLEATAKILSSKIDGGVAVVAARWKSGASGEGRDVSQTWKLEDGLWCRAP